MKMNSKIKTKIISGTLLFSMCTYTIPVFAFTKEETVYSKIDCNGDTYQTIVSTHIENNEGLDLINDISDLLNIENTNGEEEFTQEGNSLIWKAEKKDIYYQGESQKDLPIECNIKYELNGEEVKAEEIVGKAGYVKITIQYTNKEEHMVNINGQEQKMYTPFVVVAGTVLPNDTNKNIEISHGKIINTGSKSIVLGIALPGLQESLNIKKTDIEIPNDIEIMMDAEEFELGNIITFVTPKVLQEEDLSIFDEIDEIYEQIKTLETASNQIQEGSEALADGTNQLASGTKELSKGTNTAYSGAKQIQTEVVKATNQLSNDKSEALDQNTLNAIGEQAKQSANLSEEQKLQIGNQAQIVAMQAIQSQKIAIGEKAASQAINEIEKQKTQIGNQAASKAAEITLTQAQKQQIMTNVEAGLEANSNYNALPAEQQAVILQFSQNSAITVAETTAKETAKQVANQTAQETATQIAKQVANSTAQAVAEEVAGSVASTTAQSIAQTTAIQTAEKAATSTAKEVANQVKSKAQNQVVTQMNVLETGLNQLTNGLESLNDGTNALENGANELMEGANALVQGVRNFNEEGIKKICNYINGDVKDITERVEKLTELSREYNNFTMLNGENDGNVKFIMIMDAIKKQEKAENTKEDAILNTENDKSKESTK